MAHADLILLLALAASAALCLVRPAASVNWRGFAISAVLTLLLLTLTLAWWSPPGMSYARAENVRVVHGAKQDVERGLEGADCVVVFDGSSSSAFALDKKAVAEELRRQGHQPCIVSLVNHAGEHLEREWTAEELRRLLPPELQSRVDALPLLWVKEMLWLYEGNPARFAAKNRGTDRALACSNPDWGMSTLAALWTDWRDAGKNARWTREEAWDAFPADRIIATLNHALFNLFQCGRLNRLMDPPAEPQHILDEMALRPEDTRVRQWWKDAPPPGTQLKPSRTLRTRTWFRQMVEQSPAGWPQRAGMERVLFMTPVQNETVVKYSDLLVKEGTGTGLKFFNGQADLELVKRLYDPGLWQDTIHLDVDGAVLFSRWLAGHLGPVLTGLKKENRNAVAEVR